MSTLTAPPVTAAQPETTTEELLHARDGLPAQHRDRALLRDRAIEENLPMARRLARRYAGRGEPLDDLVQVAAMALVKAVDGYDSTRSDAFASYAIPCILGALKRHFRDTAWGVRVPRAMQELVLAARTTSGELDQRLGRPTTPAELADELSITTVQLRAAELAARAYRSESLDAPPASAGDGGGTDAQRSFGSTDPGYAAVDDRLLFRTLVGVLPERERRILTLRFRDELTQTQIATEVGISQMHVSRLLQMSLSRLKKAITAPPSGPQAQPRPGSSSSLRSASLTRS